MRHSRFRSGRLVLSGLAVITLIGVSAVTPRGEAPSRRLASSVRLASTTVTRSSSAAKGISVGGYALGQAVGGTTGQAASSSAAESGSDETVNANGGTLKLGAISSTDTLTGTALDAAWPGDPDSVLRVQAMGGISRESSTGVATDWTRTPASLYADWHLRWDTPQLVTPTLDLAMGTSAADPYVVAGDSNDIVADSHPYAIGDLAGGNHPDVAVAYTVGVGLNVNDGGTLFPFTVPGSTLHLGSIVTVLSGATGRTLYWRLYPGFVTRLAISHDLLLVGDETGSPFATGDPGAWYSTTTLQALAFRESGSALHATSRWTYDTGAPWAVLMAMTATNQGQTVLTWSDTPMGLGSPRPADGHVVALSTATGRVEWNDATPGYPSFDAFDPTTGLVAVVEQRDPVAGESYRVVGLRAATGAVAFTAVHDNAIPTALAVGSARHDEWLVTDVDVTDADVSVPFYSPQAGWVSAFDPRSGRQLWTEVLASAVAGVLQPGSITVTGDRAVVGSWNVYGLGISASHPYETDMNLQALSLTNGQRLWDDAGDVGDPLSVALTGSSSPLLRTVTAEDRVELVSPSTGRVVAADGLLGVVNTATQGPADAPGTHDLIVGDQSGGVFAYAGTSLTSTPRVLWHTTVGDAVTDVVVADLAGNGQPDVVVAATDQVDVLNALTGRLLYRVAFPGQYIWTVSVGQLQAGSSREDIVVPASALTVLAGSDGHTLWTYHPPVSAEFADAAVVDRTVVAEYGDTDTTGSSVGAELGLDGATGAVAWSDAQSSADTSVAELWGGVAAGAAIPGADGDGVAFTWTENNGLNRVDVRNARTGALDYSTAPNIGTYHQGYLISPSVGLVEYTGSASADITPSRTVVNQTVSATDALVATTRSGKRFVLAADGGDLHAYPLSAVRTTTYLSAVATNDTFRDLGLAPIEVDGHEDVVGFQGDLTAYTAVIGYEGRSEHLQLIDGQYGFSVLDPTCTPPATAAKAPAVSAPAVARPSTVAVTAAGVPGEAALHTFARVVVHGYRASGVPSVASTVPVGYSPTQIRSYLAATGDGAGQTVAIIDASDDTGIVGDVDTFSRQYGLPTVCTSSDTSGCFDLTVSKATSTAVADPDDILETSLDVEWIHAIVPDAHIVLVEAPSLVFSSMFAAIGQAMRWHPDAVSMSWGYNGEFSGETYYDHDCQLTTSICIVSAGDAGYPGAYPAYSRNVLAVGGTELHLTDSGVVAGESTWDLGGGGQSYFEPEPADQDTVNASGHRDLPDVSFDADPETGVAVYDSTGIYGQTGWFEVGGTSVGAPAWSAILTAADQLRNAKGLSRLTMDGFGAQARIYGLSSSSVARITSGPDNGDCPGFCTPSSGFDEITGLGSPRAGIESALAG